MKDRVISDKALYGLISFLVPTTIVMGYLTFSLLHQKLVG